MVLSSQSGRSISGGRSYMSSRRRKKSKFPIILFLALLATGIWYFAFKGPAKSNDDLATKISKNQNNSPTVNLNNNTNTPIRITPAQLTPPKIKENPTTTQTPNYLVPIVPNISIHQNKKPITTTHTEQTPQSETPNPIIDTISTNTQTNPNLANAFELQPNAKLSQGLSLIAEKKFVAGRALLSELLTSDSSLSDDQKSLIRTRLAQVNELLVFSKKVVPGDPLVGIHVTTPRFYLYSKIARKYKVTHQLLERINKVSSRKIRVPMNLKYIKGPFHVVVVKSAFRMDIYLDDPQGKPIYIRSFQVGLGKNDSTPEGKFIVRPHNKVTNPSWVNPRTRERFAANDPKNPIGEYWIGLQGVDEFTKNAKSYGIHGTDKPQTVGQQKSLGCIRLKAKDIALVYQMLVESKSTVLIAGE